MEEMFDVYDENGKYLGVKPKSFCHSKNPGVFHKPVWIWIFNSKGEILIQKRAETKKFMPNKWDGSATGHVVAGEDSLQGCIREVYEEIGMLFNEKDFEFMGEFPAPEVWEFGQVYLLKTDFAIDKIKMQEEEVSDVKWIGFEKFKKLFLSEQFMPYGINYKLRICEIIKKQLEKIQEQNKNGQ